MAYEIRGHNRSIIGNNRNFSMYDLFEDLQILIDEYKSKNVH